MKIEEIEGVGPAYAVKLAEAGVATVESLLEQGG
ncbi:MAG: helix-hairpin-helix domain-containing protein, partial [Acidobacteriota bacterium]